MQTSPLRRGALERVVALDTLLEADYRSPEELLGNKSDPLDEAIYIILSFQTDLARFASTWALLKRQYPSWESLELAPVSSVARVLRQGGLQRQKARRIKQLLAAVRELTGSLSLELLRGLDSESAERVLLRLPGLSWKGVRCVLLYSLGHEVFPIDSNVFRVFKRAGVLRSDAVYRRRALHDALQRLVAPERRRALHVNLVLHGQRVCLPVGPRCSECAACSTCPKLGVARRLRPASGLRELSERAR